MTKLLSMMTAMSVVKSLQQSFVGHKLRLNFISMRKIFICYDTFIAQGNHYPAFMWLRTPQGTSGIGGYWGSGGKGGASLGVRDYQLDNWTKLTL